MNALVSQAIRALLIAVALLLMAPQSQADETIPRNVVQVAESFDPRLEDLDVNVVREWERDGVVFQYVTFHVGVFKQKPARIAAFFAFPADSTNLPGLLHLHGGGQRAFLHEVQFFAQQGYACLSINWGGRPMEESLETEPNTDWGAVDPTQQNVPGYFNLLPGEKYLDPEPSPRNNNWYLLTLAGRRGLTFLERQPQVDPNRLGVYGHSMGGNLTVYVAGTDSRVKVAAPSVGGSGFRTQPWPLLRQQQRETPNGDVELFDATLGFESYAPHIHAPLLWLGSTNDFHGIMDDTYRTGELIAHREVRYSFAPHFNHRFTPEFSVTRLLWLNQHLKGGEALPATPSSTLTLDSDDRIPSLEVRPDELDRVERVDIFYSIDPDPQARFWRSAEATQQEGRWFAKLPIMSRDEPLFAFANVHYSIARQPSAPQSDEITSFAISSLLHTITPEELKQADVIATDSATSVIEDFARGWTDWYLISTNNPHHWEYSTRKINDPKYRGREGQSLVIEVSCEVENELVIKLTENFFRPYRGPMRDYVAVVKLMPGEPQIVSLEPSDFVAADGTALSSWEELDVLSFRAYEERDGNLLGSKTWQGSQPEFRRIEWR